MPRYFVLAAVVAVILSVVYYYLDIRAVGTNPDSLYNFSQFTTPTFLLKTFGIGYYASMIVLNVVVAAMTATMVTVSVANYRSRRLGGATAVGSLALAATTFTCPGCALPVTATLGVAMIGTSLPFLGLEFQLASFAILLVSLVWLSRKMRHEYVTPSMGTPGTDLTAPAAI